MSMYTVRTKWNVLNGGEGSTVLAFNVRGVAVVTQAIIDATFAAVHDMFASWASRVPTDVTWTWPDPAEEVLADGTLVKLWNATTTPAAVTGGSVSAYAGGAGAKIRLYTDQIVNNRRLRGGFYIVPLVGDQFTGDGRVHPDTIVALTNGVVALQNTINGSGVDLGVWSRKYDVFGDIAAISTNSEPALMRSRKV